MTRIIMSQAFREALVRNGIRVLKLGALSALAMFSGNIFRTAGQDFIQSAVKDYEAVREIVQESL